MQLSSFLEKLNSTPEQICFHDTMSAIDENYTFIPCQFHNGDLLNEENQNNGSCKIFAFAKLHNLTEEQTLQCFGDYYRIDVLQHPTATDHQNIRNFITHGWTGISYMKQPLTRL